VCAYPVSTKCERLKTHCNWILFQSLLWMAQTYRKTLSETLSTLYWTLSKDKRNCERLGYITHLQALICLAKTSMNKKNCSIYPHITTNKQQQQHRAVAAKVSKLPWPDWTSHTYAKLWFGLSSSTII